MIRTRRAAERSGRLLLVALLLCTAVAAAGAQDSTRAAPPSVGPFTTDTAPAPPPSGPRRVEGRVIRPAPNGGARPVAGLWVTLHRVARDGAGPLDSARTTADGRYAFRYTAAGDENAIYFVSAQYAGIAYFSQPLTRALVRGDDAEIAVFDTTSRAVPLSVRGHHVIISRAVSGGARTIVEVFELSNDTSVTLISGGADGSDPTWSTVLPSGAREFRVAQGDVPEDAVTARDGRVLVFAPFAPGLKQLSFSYQLTSADFPLALRLGRPTTVLEVLVADSVTKVSGAQLTEVNPVNVEGRNFRRFLAQDVPASGVITVAPPAGGVPDRRTFVIVALLGAFGVAMLFALARAFTRRGVARPARTTPSGPDPERLARQIADLDARFERERAPNDDIRLEYQAKREALKAQLTEALARRANVT